MKSYREDDDPWYVVQTNTGTDGAYVDCMKFATEQEARATAEDLLGRDAAWAGSQTPRRARVVKRPGWVAIFVRDMDEVLTTFGLVARE